MTSRIVPFETRFQSWAEERGMTWTEETLRDSGDSSAIARSLRIQPHDRADRVLFALHGAGNDALFGWVGLFKALLLSGTAIFTFDLPGHGRDGSSLFGVRRARDAVLGALESCVAGSPGLPVHALGVSLGGSILLASLPSFDGALVSATIVVAPLRIDLSPRSFLGEIRAHNLRLVWREREHYGLTGLLPSFGPFKRDVYPLRLEGTPPPGAFGYVSSLNDALDSMRLLDAAKRVDLPVLLAYGERDRVVPIGQGERIARALERGELLRVKEGTHLSTPLEPIVRDRFLSWIRECEGA